MRVSKKVLAFIGARSGSKGLKDKNIKRLNGKPLMAWTIEAALASEIIDLVVVSTDSMEYAEIARSYGAKVILRPENLAGDDASLMAALQHGYQKIQDEFGDFDTLVNLQPTSPLRTFEHIDEALMLYSQNKMESNIRVFSCLSVPAKYAWIMSCDQQGYAQFVNKGEQKKTAHSRQKNKNVMLPNGAIFILPARDLTRFYNGKCIPYIMNERDSIDIDTLDDFEKAAKIMLEVN
ncbi:MAG: acylneuraminate cytidylyltransferase family protein [Alteromonadaceae bacterium]